MEGIFPKIGAPTGRALIFMVARTKTGAQPKPLVLSGQLGWEINRDIRAENLRPKN